MLELVFTHTPRWVNPVYWALRVFAGVPTHVDVIVDGVAYVVGPGRHGCAQLDAAAYLEARKARGELVAHLKFPAADVARIAEAAEMCAVGPMTRRRAVWRYLTRRADFMDLDCVAAACMVLHVAGIRIDPPRTPKGLLACLRTNPQNL